MAQQDTIDKIINIQFKYSELVEGWSKATREIEINKKNLSELKNEYKLGQMSASEYNKAVLAITSTTKALTAEKKAYEKEIQSNIKIETRAIGSINQLQANVSKLTAKYNDLSAAERESKFGQRLANDIKSQQEAINNAQQALGNYRSKVGSYEDAIKNVLGLNNQFTNSLLAATEEGNGFTSMLNMAGNALFKIVKQAAAFIATPLGVALAALSAAYYLVSSRIREMNDRIKESEDLFYQNEKAQSYARAYMDAYTRAIDKQAVAWINAKGEAAEYWAKVKIFTRNLWETWKWQKGLTDHPLTVNIDKAQVDEIAKQRQILAEQEEALQQRRRDINLENADLEEKIALARLNAMNKEKYSAAARREYAQEAIILNNKYYDNLKEIAQKEKDIADMRVSFTNSSTAELNAQNDAAVKLKKIDAQRAASQRELLERINSTTGEIKNQGVEIKKQASIQLNLEKQLSKSVLELRQDSLEKELDISRMRFARERQELENKLKYDLSLTTASREAINKMILNLEERRYKDEANIRQHWAEKEFQEEIRNEENRIKMQFKVRDEMNKLAMAQVRNKNNASLNSGIKDIELKAKQAIANEELRQAKANLDEITQMSEKEWEVRYESLQQYEIARLEAENRVQDAIRTTTQLAIQGEIDQLNATQNLVGSLRGLFASLGDDFEGFAIAQQALAIAQAIIDAQKATMAALAASMPLGPIAGPAAFAAQKSIIDTQLGISIATIIAQAIPSFFAQGGLVSGPGTGTSDSIPAMLSNGEAVMTAKAVNDWGAVLSAMNVSSGGNAINVSNLPQRGDGMRGMERMMERVLLNLPNPIVLVKDIDTGQRRVKVATNLGKLGGNRKK